MTNSTTIVGRVVQDAEHRMTRNGQDAAIFSVAVNERRVDRSTGELHEYVSFIDCVMFGKQAASLAPYLVKGKLVSITGALRQGRWEDANGRKRSRVSIVVRTIDLLSPKRPIGMPAEVTA